MFVGVRCIRFDIIFGICSVTEFMLCAFYELLIMFSYMYILILYLHCTSKIYMYNNAFDNDFLKVSCIFEGHGIFTFIGMIWNNTYIIKIMYS